MSVTLTMHRDDTSKIQLHQANFNGKRLTLRASLAFVTSLQTLYSLPNSEVEDLGGGWYEIKTTGMLSNGELATELDKALFLEFCWASVLEFCNFLCSQEAYSSGIAKNKLSRTRHEIRSVQRLSSADRFPGSASAASVNLLVQRFTKPQRNLEL